MTTLAIAIVLLIGTPAFGQIYEWRDAGGSRHFTNDIEDIPEELRAEARIVVRARPAPAEESPSDGDAEAVAADEATKPDRRRRREEDEPPRQAQVIYDHSYRFARPAPAPEPQPQQQVPNVNVNIAGPLSVSQVVLPESRPMVDYYPGYPVYPGSIPLGYRPERRHRSEPRPAPVARGGDPWVTGPAPLSPVSPSFMPSMRSTAPAPVGRR